MGQLADHVNAMLATFERQAQTAEENELAYRVLFDQSPLTVVLTRRNGEIVDVNERGVQELSLERGQIIGKTVESLGLVGADSAPVLSGLLKRSDRRIERLETSIPGAGGRVRHLVISARGVTFHGEELVLMIVQDVTERVLTMEALQQSEKVYREAIEGAGAVPYAKMEHPRHYAFMGDGIEELTGYTSRQMTPDLWNSIIRQVIPLGEALGLGLPEALRRVYARDLHSWKADLLVQTRAGDLRWITDSSVILRDPEGQVLGSVGILTDVSDRKRAEEALQQSEERFRTLVKNLQVIAFAIDTQGVFTLSEGLGLQKLGQRPGQLVGLSVFDVYSSQPEILEHVRKALACRPCADGAHLRDPVYAGPRSSRLRDRGDRRGLRHHRTNPGGGGGPGVEPRPGTPGSGQDRASRSRQPRAGGICLFRVP
jgi:PAS domain S-box-containing protein